jgi:hypothetical protein
MYSSVLAKTSQTVSATKEYAEVWCCLSEAPICDPPELDAFLLFNRDELIALFHDLKDRMAHRGLMANSSSAELLEIVTDCCEFVLQEPESPPSEDESDSCDDQVIDSRERMFDYT